MFGYKVIPLSQCRSVERSVENRTDLKMDLSTSMVTVAPVHACTNCYHLALDCTCDTETRQHVYMDRAEYEKKLNEFYASKTQPQRELGAVICLDCECWWCDGKVVCNPCTQCILGNGCLFPQDNGEGNNEDDSDNCTSEDSIEESYEDDDQDNFEVHTVSSLRTGQKSGQDYKSIITLKARDTVTIQHGCAAYIRTDVRIERVKPSTPGSIEFREKMKLEVAPLGEHWWLSKQAGCQLLVKGDIFRQTLREFST